MDLKDVDNNDNKENYYDKYVKMNLEDRYEFCVKNYTCMEINNKEVFGKNLNMRYSLNGIYHNFYYDFEKDKFLLNSNELNTINLINNLNQMIMYIRVYNMDESSINWINPLYSKYIEYLNDDNEWKSISSLYL